MAVSKLASLGETEQWEYAVEILSTKVEEWLAVIVERVDRLTLVFDWVNFLHFLVDDIYF